MHTGTTCSYLPTIDLLWLRPIQQAAMVSAPMVSLSILQAHQFICYYVLILAQLCSYSMPVIKY